MATAPLRPRTRKIEYPTGDGKPMAETEIHRNELIDLIQTWKELLRRRANDLRLGQHADVLRGGESSQARLS